MLSATLKHFSMVEICIQCFVAMRLSAKALYSMEGMSSFLNGLRGVTRNTTFLAPVALRANAAACKCPLCGGLNVPPSRVRVIYFRMECHLQWLEYSAHLFYVSSSFHILLASLSFHGSR